MTETVHSENYDISMHISGCWVWWSDREELSS